MGIRGAQLAAAKPPPCALLSSLTNLLSPVFAFRIRHALVKVDLGFLRPKATMISTCTVLLVVLSAAITGVNSTVSVDLENENGRHGRPWLPPFLSGTPENEQVR